MRFDALFPGLASVAASGRLADRSDHRRAADRSRHHRSCGLRAFGSDRRAGNGALLVGTDLVHHLLRHVLFGHLLAGPADLWSARCVLFALFPCCRIFDDDGRAPLGIPVWPYAHVGLDPLHRRNACRRLSGRFARSHLGSAGHRVRLLPHGPWRGDRAAHRRQPSASDHRTDGRSRRARLPQAPTSCSC